MKPRHLTPESTTAVDRVLMFIAALILVLGVVRWLE